MTEVRRQSPAATPPDPHRATAPQAPMPFSPRRGLFALLGVMLFAWLALLLVLYFTTVYPHRHSAVEYPGENVPATP